MIKSHALKTTSGKITAIGTNKRPNQKIPLENKAVSIPIISGPISSVG